MGKPVSGTLQRWIMIISVGTLLSVFAGLFIAGMAWQSVLDKISFLGVSLSKYETTTDGEIKGVKDDVCLIKKDVVKIKECVAAHTGKTLNGTGR